MGEQANREQKQPIPGVNPARRRGWPRLLGGLFSGALVASAGLVALNEALPLPDNLPSIETSEGILPNEAPADLAAQAEPEPDTDRANEVAIAVGLEAEEDTAALDPLSSGDAGGEDLPQSDPVPAESPAPPAEEDASANAVLEPEIAEPDSAELVAERPVDDEIADQDVGPLQDNNTVDAIAIEDTLQTETVVPEADGETGAVDEAPSTDPVEVAEELAIPEASPGSSEVENGSSPGEQPPLAEVPPIAEGPADRDVDPSIAEAEPLVEAEAEDGSEARDTATETLLEEVSPEPDSSIEIAVLPSEPVTQTPLAPAWERNAVPFDAPDDVPLISVILEQGTNFQDAVRIDQILELGLPLTLALVPDRDAVSSIGAKAKAAGYEVIAHLPMEPRGTANPGPEALTVAMTAEEAAARTRRLVARLPEAVAASNFMGSKATEDADLMRVVIETLSDQGLAFVDTRTSPRSKAYRVAEEIGSRRARNSRFVPAEVSPDQAYRLLERAAGEARQRGGTVLIGPASRGMLLGIQRWALERNGRRARLAPISAVLRAEGGR
ncbi:MAG: divergent polysaccharide deacetylase family protein [Pseudomonadota bacterium]